VTLPSSPRSCVGCPFRVALSSRVSIFPPTDDGAVLAAMSMQLTVARAVGSAYHDLSFVRTQGRPHRKGLAFAAFHEASWAGLLVVGAVIVYADDYVNVMR